MLLLYQAARIIDFELVILSQQKAQDDSVQGVTDSKRIAASGT